LDLKHFLFLKRTFDSSQFAARASLASGRDVRYKMREPSLSFQTTDLNTSFKSIGSTSTFDIPERTTIPSDSATHKVTITIVNLTPEFEYETVPRKNAYAYLTAKVTNTSDYPRRSGAANVFFVQQFRGKGKNFNENTFISS